MKKRFIAIILVLTVVFALVGCGDDGSNSTADIGGVKIVVENEGDKMYVEGKADGTPLKISFTEAGTGRDWIVEIGKEFLAKNPSYVLYLDGDPQLTSSLSTKLESGKNLSDIFMPLSTAWEMFAYKGWLEPIDDVYAMKPDGESGKTNEEKMEDVFAEYSKLTTKDGEHYYVMPWNQNATGICYNVNMFKEYNWQIPTTTDELEALCKQILKDTDGKVKPFAYPGKIGGYFDFIGTTWWMQACGMEKYKSLWNFESAEIYNPSKEIGKAKELALNEFLRFFASDKGYCVQGSLSKDHITSQMDFINGKAAMIVNASWLECEMLTSMDEDYVMGMMRIPYLSSAKKDDKGEFKKINYVTPLDFMI
ncbi:MAG: ABC transporter substrate-binding protein, partial [Clostridia bacterium]|nr:ABC transporter substrate-binding protein [Clostridia bacterium]